MSQSISKLLHLDPWAVRIALTSAQALALIAYVLGLVFLLRTSGGTLFLFTVVAPLLAMVAVLGIAAVVAYRFARHQSLFVFAAFEPGDLICVQGDESDWAYFILSGEVDIVRRENGAEYVLGQLTKGHHFGEAALVSNLPHYVTARAVTRTRVAALGRRNFLSILRYAPFAQQDILKTVNEKALRQSERRARRTANNLKEN
jgi:hypothetical protein